jgi:hypothetical protein
MSKQIFKDTLGWGFLLWFFGYVLGMLFFAIMPASVIGWAIMPIGVAITLWVLLKKIKGNSLKYYLILACVWTLIAIILDYFFIVKALKPADGYYKFDVYLYYAFTLILPIIIGLRKKPDIQSALK